MPWVSVALTVNAASVEALSDALLEAGAISVDVTDAQAGTPDEHALFGEPGEPATGEWMVSRINSACRGRLVWIPSTTASDSAIPMRAIACSRVSPYAINFPINES